MLLKRFLFFLPFGQDYHFLFENSIRISPVTS
jgi:hypothetical protein